MNFTTLTMPLTKLVRAGANLTLADDAGEHIAMLALVPMLLAVAIWNRFPLIFYDTGAYVLEGLGGHFLVERSPVYSLLLRLGGAGISLWAIVVLQAAATAFVAVETARCVAPKLSLGVFLAMGAGLVAATGLPWYVGEVEPDCFAALTVLIVYLLAFRRTALGRARACVLLGVGALAAASHASHLLLAAGLVIALVVYLAIRKLQKESLAWPRPHLANPVILIVTAISLVVSANFVFTRQVFVTRAGPAFFFARLLQDRIVTRLLDETCPKSGYRLCAYKDVLPPTANAWLWTSYSPFFKLGGFEGTRVESERIIRDSLVRYPILNIETAFADAGRQFISFKTGDQVEPQQWALRSTLTHLLPAQVPHYLSARQQEGQIRFRAVNWVHVPVGYVSLLALTVAIGIAVWLAEWELLLFLTIVMVALMGNALICGALSNPHDRYQSRLIWLAPFAVSLAVAARATNRKKAAG